MKMWCPCDRTKNVGFNSAMVWMFFEQGRSQPFVTSDVINYGKFSFFTFSTLKTLVIKKCIFPKQPKLKKPLAVRRVKYLT